MSGPDIILVDDEKDIRHSYGQSLELAGYSVRGLDKAEAVPALVGPDFPGIVITDIRMAGMDGMTLLSRLQALDVDLPVVLVTGHGDLPLAVRAIREGAYDFIEKPCPARQLVDVAARALDRRRLVLENRRLRALAGRHEDIEARLLGRAPAMVALRRRIAALAAAQSEVMIVGETGTGKQVAARLLHDLSPRAARPFVVVDCAALPPDQALSELFGHEAGAVPYSARARFGRIEQAHGGTLLLDDLPALPLDLQARLLRVVEDRAVTRLGSTEPMAVDVRFVATSTSDPELQVEAGRLRSDLLYRLQVVALRMPSLAERREDISLLFLHLVEEAAARESREAPEVPSAVLADLLRREWPGNVRELRNAAERFVLGVGQGDEFPADPVPLSLAEQTALYERSLIAAALATANGQLKSVYETLGISRKTLYEKMQKFGLDKRDFSEGE